MKHCWNCGAENRDDAVWCVRCGVSLEDRVRNQVDSEPGYRPVQRVEPVHVQRASHVRTRNLHVAPDSPTMRPVELNTRTASRRGGGRYVAVVFAIIAALLVIAWGFHSYTTAMDGASDADETADVAHRTQTVTVSFDIPGYMEGSSSPIPVHVTGSDLDGNSVDELHLLSTYNNTVDLKRGTYTFEVVGSPVTAAGLFFDIGQGKATVVISEDGIKVVGSDSEQPTFTFTQAALENVTDDDITATQQWMEEGGMDSDAVSRYINALTSARDARLQEIASESEESGEADITTDDFSVSLPDSWKDQVEVQTTTSGGHEQVTVVLKGHTSYELVQFKVTSGSATGDTQDNVEQLVTSQSGSGVLVEVWCTNWPYLCAMGEAEGDDAVIEELVSLETGGAMTMEQASSASSSALSTVVTDYVEENIVPTLKIGSSQSGSSSSNSSSSSNGASNTASNGSSSR